MERPPLIAAPSQGLMRAEHFQMAWATNDIDRAQALFRDHYGIREWARLQGPLAAGGQIRVELAWCGTVMYELMWAQGQGSAIYMDRLPEGDFVIKHHHLGYLIDNEAEWDALLAKIEQDGHHMPHFSANPGFMTSCFVDAPALGHYLEYIWPEETGRAFFASVPGN